MRTRWKERVIDASAERNSYGKAPLTPRLPRANSFYIPRLNLVCYNTMSTYGNTKALMSLGLGTLDKNNINLNLLTAL